jgi:hypothetical protein
VGVRRKTISHLTHVGEVELRQTCAVFIATRRHFWHHASRFVGMVAPSHAPASTPLPSERSRRAAPKPKDSKRSASSSSSSGGGAAGSSTGASSSRKSGAAIGSSSGSKPKAAASGKPRKPKAAASASASPAAAPSEHGTANHGLLTKLSPIGEGSFGRIWLVRHNQSGGTHVLKEIPLKGLSPGEVEATRLEVEVLRRLEHPNIVAFISSYEDAGVVGIVMEHAGGGDLQKEIDKRLATGEGRREHFPEYMIRDYARQMGTALSYIHTVLMLLHRDLKPANVFLSSAGAVKLGDFGFCKLINVRRINLWPQKQSDGSPPEPRPEPPPPRIKVKGYKPRPYDHAVGTPLYMSPEHISGSPFDRAADTWAFACTIFETMGLESPWSQILDGWGGMDGGMEGLYRLVTSAQRERRRPHSPGGCRS